MVTFPKVVDAVPLQAPLPQDILSSLYTAMIKARLLSKRRRKAPHISEAILAATLQNTEPTDLLVSAGPDPIFKALSETAIAEAEANRDNDSARSRVIAAGNDAVVGIATGLALALRSASSGSLVITIVPSAITRGAAWKQATEFAAINRLPIVFVSDGTASRALRAHEGHNLSHWPFPTIAVDGRDVIAVYRVTKEAFSAARRGHGPTLVDGVNFVAPGRRGKDHRDPVASFRGYLKRHNAWSEEWSKKLETDLERELAGR